MAGRGAVVTAARVLLLVAALGLALGAILAGVFDGLVDPTLGVVLSVAVLAGALHLIPAAIRSATRSRGHLERLTPYPSHTGPRPFPYALKRRELLRGAESAERRRYRGHVAQLERSLEEFARDESHGRLGL